MSEEKKTQKDKTTKGTINKKHHALLPENYNQPIRAVEQGECKTILNSGALITEGVGPCIAVVTYGTAIYRAEDKDGKNQFEEFISLYHSEDSFYELYCVAFDDAPSLKKLIETHVPLPTLIKHENNFWVYGLNANKNPQLTKLNSFREYKNLLFSNQPTRNSITEALYKEIGEAKAHCHYFDSTGKEEVEQEDNFNYCLEITRQDLVEKLFSNIDSKLAKKEDVKLVKIEINQIALIGGQKSDPFSELSGSEMRAMALKRIFENPTALISEIQEDMELTVDFSQSKLLSDQLLQTQGENYFDLAVLLSETENKFLVKTVEASTKPLSPREKIFEEASKGQKRLLENEEKNENPLKRSRTGSINPKDPQNQVFYALQLPQVMTFSTPLFPAHFPSGIMPCPNKNGLPAIIDNAVLKIGM